MNIPDNFSEGLRNNFWVKCLNSLIRIRDPESFLALDPGWKKFSFASSRLTLYGRDDIISEVQLLQAGEAGQGVPTHRLDGVPGQAQAPQLL